MTDTVKLKWKVASRPTGRYASFHTRNWPSAEYPNGSPAASVQCEDDYSPARAREEAPHADLFVFVAEHFPKSEWSVKGGFKWRKLKGTFKTLAEAKDAAARCLAAHPHFAPKEV
jgi:hypothetical protein